MRIRPARKASVWINPFSYLLCANTFVELATGGVVIGTLLSRYVSGSTASNGKAEQNTPSSRAFLFYLWYVSGNTADIGKAEQNATFQLRIFVFFFWWGVVMLGNQQEAYVDKPPIHSNEYVYSLWVASAVLVFSLGLDVYLGHSNSTRVTSSSGQSSCCEVTISHLWKQLMGCFTPKPFFRCRVRRSKGNQSLRKRHRRPVVTYR